MTDSWIEEFGDMMRHVRSPLNEEQKYTITARAGECTEDQVEDHYRMGKGYAYAV